MAETTRIPWFHYVANPAMRLALSVLLKLDMQGLENTPKEGPVLAAYSHTSFLDPVVSTSFLRWDVLPMAKIELFRFPYGIVIGGYGGFPIRRGEGDLAAMRRALQVVKDNHVMLISPEGTRTKSGVLETAKEGVALLAIKSRAPILPIALWGGKPFWNNLKRFRRTPYGMRVGEPLGIVPIKGKTDRMVLRAITDELMYYIAQMLPPEYRGHYSDVEHVVPQYMLPLAQLESGENKPQAEVMSMS